MENCIFCKIVKGSLPADKIFEDEKFYAFLTIKPNNPGHTLLIPKMHCKDIHEIPDEILKELGTSIKKLAGVIKESTKADGINIGMNNGPAAGQEVFHAHIHIIPRYLDDGLKHWAGKPYKNENIKNEVVKKISAAL